MISLQVGDLVLIAGRVLGRDTGATLDLLDVEAAGAALASKPAAGVRDDPAGQAAALLHALVRRRPFQQANDEIAVVATVQFLAVSGWDADLEPPEAARTVLSELAAGTLGVAGLADWLAPRLRPHDRQPDQAGVLDDIENVTRTAMAAWEKSMTAWLPGPWRRRANRFARFTERARRVVEVAAEEEARLLSHNHVGTEHLLLAMLQEEEGLAAKALTSMGISLEAVRGQVEEIIGRQGAHAPEGDIPFTPRAQKVLELSLREALQLGHNYIGTEHVLLGLIREGEGLAAEVLVKLGADLSSVRGTVIQLLSGATGGGPPRGGGMDADTLIVENLRLHREVERLRGVLRRRGVDPDEGTSQSA